MGSSNEFEKFSTGPEGRWDLSLGNNPLVQQRIGGSSGSFRTRDPANEFVRRSGMARDAEVSSWRRSVAGSDEFKQLVGAELQAKSFAGAGFPIPRDAT